MLSQPQRHAEARAKAMPTDALPVALQGVTRRFGSVTAVDNVSLTLNPGEITAVLGPNGAGKTTLVKLMLGLVRPTRGSVQLFGLEPKARQARERIGVMLQQSGVPETLRVRELIWLFRHYYPNPLPLEEIVALAGLAGLEGRLYGQLSGGQKQRLHFALAICGDPKLIFLDEPTAALDVELRQAFWESVLRFRARGATVLFTTHHLDEADSYAERIIVIHRGKLRADGPKGLIKAQVAGKRVRLATRLTPEELRGEPLVKGVRALGGRLELLTDAPEQLIVRLMALDPEAGELEVDSGVLEEVFVRLVKGPLMPAGACDADG